MPHGTLHAARRRNGKYFLGFVRDTVARRHSETQRMAGLNKKMVEMHKMAGMEGLLLVYIPDENRYELTTTANSVQDTHDMAQRLFTKVFEFMEVQERATGRTQCSEEDRTRAQDLMQKLKGRFVINHPEEYEDRLFETQRTQGEVDPSVKRRGKKVQMTSHGAMWLPRKMINCMKRIYRGSFEPGTSQKTKERILTQPYSKQYMAPDPFSFPLFSRVVPLHNSVETCPNPCETATDDQENRAQNYSTFVAPSAPRLLEEHDECVEVTEDDDDEDELTASVLLQQQYIKTEAAAAAASSSHTPAAAAVASAKKKKIQVGPVPQEMRYQSYQRWLSSIEHIAEHPEPVIVLENDVEKLRRRRERQLQRATATARKSTAAAAGVSDEPRPPIKRRRHHHHHHRHHRDDGATAAAAPSKKRSASRKKLCKDAAATEAPYENVLERLRQEFDIVAATGAAAAATTLSFEMTVYPQPTLPLRMERVPFAAVKDEPFHISDDMMQCLDAMAMSMPSRMVTAS